MSMLRNREVMRALWAWAALTVVATAVGYRLADRPGAVSALAASVLACLPFLALTRRRYRKLAQLSARIDDVLHGDRTLDFSSMSEGELAILCSELDKMVMRLNLTADELTREKQALADALADISHQIKTPLTSLSITTELVRKHLAEVPECAEDLERMRRIEQLEIRVEHLVASLLKLARLDAGAIRLASDQVLVDDVVRSAVQPLAIALDIADVALQVDIADGCTFTGDPAWTAEAIGNIVKNCMEHTPSGGTVRIVAWEDALACRIRVTDTGPGIAEEDLGRIWDRFYQADPARSGERGAGLGLPIVREIVSLHGGVAEAESRAGHGSVFRVIFPRKNEGNA